MIFLLHNAKNSTKTLSKKSKPQRFIWIRQCESRLRQVCVISHELND